MILLLIPIAIYLDNVITTLVEGIDNATPFMFPFSSEITITGIFSKLAIPLRMMKVMGIRFNVAMKTS